jgi:presenilin-like A22 family membrane protease
MKILAWLALFAAANAAVIYGTHAQMAGGMAGMLILLWIAAGRLA